MSVTVRFECDLAGNTKLSQYVFTNQHYVDYVREVVLGEFKGDLIVKSKYYELYYNNTRLNRGPLVTLAHTGVKADSWVYLQLKLRLMKKVELSSERNFGGSAIPGFSSAVKAVSIASAGAAVVSFTAANLLGANIQTRAEGDRLIEDLEHGRVQGQPALMAVKAAVKFGRRAVSLSVKGAADIAGTHLKEGGKVIGLEWANWEEL